MRRIVITVLMSLATAVGCTRGENQSGVRQAEGGVVKMLDLGTYMSPKNPAEQMRVRAYAEADDLETGSAVFTLISTAEDGHERVAQVFTATQIDGWNINERRSYEFDSLRISLDGVGETLSVVDPNRILNASEPMDDTIWDKVN